MATVTLRPNGDGYAVTWTRNAEDADWKCVDEAVADEDTTYLSASVAWRIQMVALEDYAAGGTITNVRVYGRFKEVGGDAKIRFMVRSGGSNDTAGSDTNFTDAYADYYYDWAINPITSLAWTDADIDGLEVGMTTRDLTNEHRCTQLWVVVTYTPVGGLSIPVAMHHYGHTIGKIIRG